MTFKQSEEIREYVNERNHYSAIRVNNERPIVFIGLEFDDDCWAITLKSNIFYTTEMEHIINWCKENDLIMWINNGDLEIQ